MPSRSNVLCGCGHFMRVEKNGVTVEELAGDGTPYKLWDADLYACSHCDAVVITGFGRAPLKEHWQPDYPEARKHFGPVFTGQ